MMLEWIPLAAIGVILVIALLAVWEVLSDGRTQRRYEQELQATRQRLAPLESDILPPPSNLDPYVEAEVLRRARETEESLREGLGLPPGREVSLIEARELGNQPLRSWFGVLAPRDCGCCGRSPLSWARAGNRLATVILTCDCGWWYTMQRLGVIEGRRMDIKTGHQDVTAGTCVRVDSSRPIPPTPLIPPRPFLSRPMRRFR